MASNCPQTQTGNNMERALVMATIANVSYQCLKPLFDNSKTYSNDRVNTALQSKEVSSVIGSDWKVLMNGNKPMSNQNMVAITNGKEIVIAVRGTELSNFADVMGNDVLSVFSGELNRVDSCLDFVDQVMELADKLGLKVSITGHSLGGAIAEIVALKKGLDCYTFNGYQFSTAKSLFGSSFDKLVDYLKNQRNNCSYEDAKLTKTFISKLFNEKEKNVCMDSFKNIKDHGIKKILQEFIDLKAKYTENSSKLNHYHLSNDVLHSWVGNRSYVQPGNVQKIDHDANALKSHSLETMIDKLKERVSNNVENRQDPKLVSNLLRIANDLRPKDSQSFNNYLKDASISGWKVINDKNGPLLSSNMVALQDVNSNRGIVLFSNLTDPNSKVQECQDFVNRTKQSCEKVELAGYSNGGGISEYIGLKNQIPYSSFDGKLLSHNKQTIQDCNEFGKYFQIERPISSTFSNSSIPPNQMTGIVQLNKTNQDGGMAGISKTLEKLDSIPMNNNENQSNIQNNIEIQLQNILENNLIMQEALRIMNNTN